MLVTSMFSFSQKVFYPYQKNFNFSVTFFLSSASDFNLDQSKNLSFGKELITVNVSCRHKREHVCKMYHYEVPFITKMCAAVKSIRNRESIMLQKVLTNLSLFNLHRLMPGNLCNSLSHNHVITSLRKSPFENIVGKGENAG